MYHRPASQSEMTNNEPQDNCFLATPKPRDVKLKFTQPIQKHRFVQLAYDGDATAIQLDWQSDTGVASLGRHPSIHLLVVG